MARGDSRTNTIILNRARDLIERRVHSELHIPQLASDVGVGTATLPKLLADGLGCTIADYIRDKALDTARTILENGATVSGAAEQARYSSPKNFSTAFRRRFGITPRQARSGITAS